MLIEIEQRIGKFALASLPHGVATPANINSAT
jgi:hypothetical protein